MQGVDGGHHPGRYPVNRAQLELVLVEQGVETVGFVGMTSGVFPQSVIDVELPHPFGKGVGGVFAGQPEQVLIAPNDRGWTDKKGAIKGLIQRLINTLK